MIIAYKNKSTGDIEAIYEGCDTNSTKYRNEAVYERIENATEDQVAQFRTFEAANVVHKPVKSFEERVRDVLKAEGLIS